MTFTQVFWGGNIAEQDIHKFNKNIYKLSRRRGQNDRDNAWQAFNQQKKKISSPVIFVWEKKNGIILCMYRQKVVPYNTCCLLAQCLFNGNYNMFMSMNMENIVFLCPWNSYKNMQVDLQILVNIIIIILYF